MSDLVREFSFDVNFQEDKFERTEGNSEIIKIVENDNLSTKFKFNFQEDIPDEENLLVKIKHNSGFVKQYVVSSNNKSAEITLNNSITVAGTLKMSISRIGSNNEILTPTQFQDKILVKESIYGDAPTPEDVNVLEGLISQVNVLNKATEDATKAAEAATKKANTAATNADTATGKANTAAKAAETATSNANTATGKANTAATNADTATGKANTAATNAEAATKKANTAATNAEAATEKANTATNNANEATEKAKAATNAANTAKSEIESKFEEIQSAYQQQVNTDASLELAAARTNSDGITYNSLKERLDAADGGKGKIYGIKRKITNNTVSSFTRICDAIGMVANATKNGQPVENDFDKCYPWSDIITCNVDRESGKILAYFGEAEFAFDGSNGEVFTKIPEFYWKREVKTENEEDYEYIYIADYAKAGFNKSEEFLIARYNLSTEADGLAHSKSGVIPRYNTNLATFRNLAKAIPGTCLLDYRIFIIQMLYLVEYADYNSQTKLGNGLISYSTAKAIKAEENTNKIVVASAGTGLWVGKTICIGATDAWNSSVAKDREITAITDYNSGGIVGKEITFSGEPVNIVVDNVIWGSAQKTGELDSLGMKSGCLINNNYHPVIYRGIENIFGNVWQHVDGLNIKEYEAYICKDPESYANDKFDEPYEKIGYINADTTDSYIKKLGYDREHPEVALPVEVKGSSSTGVCDNYWCNTGNRIAYVGGNFNHGGAAGFFAWSCNNPSSNSYWYYGARLLKYQV